MSHTRKLICILLSGAALSAAAPAFADRGYGHGYERGYGHHYRGGPVYYGPPVVYAPAPVYYAPPPVYYGPPAVAYAPAPAYYAPSQPAHYRSDAGMVIGTVAGAMIGNQFGQGGARVAATAAGALIGGALGSRY